MMRAGDMAVVGAGDLDDRLKLIAFTIHKGYADPWTHEWVAQLVRGLPPKDAMAELRRLFQALAWPRIRYTFHPRGKDRFQTLRRTVEMGVADCDQITVAVDTAAHILGFDVGARVYSFTGESWDHIAALVCPDRDYPDRTQPLVMELTDGPKGTPESAVFGYQVAPHRVRLYRDFWFDLK